MFQWLSFGTRRMNRQLLQNTCHVLVNSVWIVDLLTQSSWQTEISVMACRLHPVGNPKRKVWWAQHQVFPQLWNQGYRTSRRKNHTSEGCVISQDFIKFWGNFFAFILNALIEFSQGFKTFFYLFKAFNWKTILNILLFLEEFLEKIKEFKILFSFLIQTYAS
jgi:hypothetical protein